MNLEEIILSMGDDFRELVYHSHRTSEPTSRRWTAKGGKRTIGHWMLCSSKEPLHAVLKLKAHLDKAKEVIAKLK